MATKVTMEALSPTMEEGRLVKWLKAEGDSVKVGDIIAEVETDKAVMELTARGEGVLRKLLLAEGGTAEVGSLLAVIAGADEDISALTGGAAGDNKAAAPGNGSGGNQGKLAKSSDGSKAEPEAAATKPSTDKQSPDKPSAGKSEGATKPASGMESAVAAPPSEESNDAGGRVRASPLARRMAREAGVELARMSGSGPGGRIIKRDVESAAQQPAAVSSRIDQGVDFEDIPLTQIRKTIARRLSESIGPIPTFYLTAELDLERVAEMRTAMAEMGDQYKVSFNDIIMKAVATSLARHPECNAHWLGDRIRQFNRVHLGMAVATDEGLIVPVIFDADTKPMSVIASESRELAKKARDRKLTPQEYTGSTFSVSNLGMFGIDQFTAIINPPESGILAIGGIEEKPVNGKSGIEFRRRMRITMSCDHRVIDGAVGARFLQTLRQMIENPLMLVY